MKWQKPELLDFSHEKYGKNAVGECGAGSGDSSICSGGNNPGTTCSGGNSPGTGCGPGTAVSAS
jgi:hypothetical protein